MVCFSLPFSFSIETRSVRAIQRLQTIFLAPLAEVLAGSCVGTGGNLACSRSSAPGKASVGTEGSCASIFYSVNSTSCYGIHMRPTSISCNSFNSLRISSSSSVLICPLRISSISCNQQQLVFPRNHRRFQIQVSLTFWYAIASAVSSISFSTSSTDISLCICSSTKFPVLSPSNTCFSTKAYSIECVYGTTISVTCTNGNMISSDACQLF